MVEMWWFAYIIGLSGRFIKVLVKIKARLVAGLALNCFLL